MSGGQVPWGHASSAGAAVDLRAGLVISARPAHPAIVSEADYISAPEASAPRGPVGSATRRNLLAGGPNTGTAPVTHGTSGDLVHPARPAGGLRPGWRQSDEREVLVGMLAADPGLMAARPGQEHTCSNPCARSSTSVNDTFKGQLNLEQHGDHPRRRDCPRPAARIVAFTGAIWHNDAIIHGSPSGAAGRLRPSAIVSRPGPNSVAKHPSSHQELATLRYQHSRRTSDRRTTTASTVCRVAGTGGRRTLRWTDRAACRPPCAVRTSRPPGYAGLAERWPGPWQGRTGQSRTRPRAAAADRAGTGARSRHAPVRPDRFQSRHGPPAQAIGICGGSCLMRT